MALFFDAEWFDAKLKARGATRQDLANVLKLSSVELAELWKDQRELKSHELLAISQFLNAPPEEIAHRAGISTPVPRAADASAMAERVEELNGRLIKLERMMVELKALLLERKS